MALINEVKAVCDRLAPLGWRDLLKKVTGDALNITQSSAAKLAEALAKPLGKVDRKVAGFADFAGDGRRGIEPASPARSLLYHALASPGVALSGGLTIKGFPTQAELTSVENYVFAAAKLTLAAVKAKAGNKPLSVVVFAREYRPGKDTAHRRHADLAFSRTGVSRVGTAAPLYDPVRRGWLPFVDGKPHGLRALPAQYSAFLAVRVKGSRQKNIPMRFQDGDAGRNFWLPVHKLFSGGECLSGLTLDVAWSSQHVNEKLRRVHMLLKKLEGAGFDTGVPKADWEKPPFKFQKGIAELDASLPGLLLPVSHKAMVEEAKFAGKRAGYMVPAGRAKFESTIKLPSDDDGENYRSGPEYVHARRRLDNNADLNQLDNVNDVVNAGGYMAVHYVDFTGDGWVSAAVTGLPASVGKTQPAYSLVTAPDFYPACGQRELTEWAETLPEAILKVLWDTPQETPPNSLSDERIPANLNFEVKPFSAAETTITSVVSLAGSGTAAAGGGGADVLRHSSLPDDAAGVFAPGWDVSSDRLSGVDHLASYGLGSPFPEDAKLCAALSTFWPGAAPDATRALEPALAFVTISPMTDEEIGQSGSLPWDGIKGPRIVKSGGQEFAEYARFDQADYVKSALEGKFSIAITGKVTAKEYQARVLSMGLVYLTDKKVREEFLVYSFRKLVAGDGEQLAAEEEAEKTLLGPVYRFETILPVGAAKKVGRVWRTKFSSRRIYLCAPEQRVVLQKKPGEKWKVAPIPNI